MKIRRTYKEKSLKFGKAESVDEAKAREVFGQTSVAHHQDGACGVTLGHYCCELPIAQLSAGGIVETFFSKWELIEA